MTTPERIRRRQWSLIGLLGLTATLAVAALAIALATNHATTIKANQERIQARYSNCVLLRRIVLVATPPGRQARAQAFLARTPLANCNQYANTK